MLSLERWERADSTPTAPGAGAGSAAVGDPGARRTCLRFPMRFPMEENVIRLLPRMSILAAPLLSLALLVAAAAAAAETTATATATAPVAPPAASVPSLDKAIEKSIEMSIDKGLAWVLEQDVLEVGDLHALQQLDRAPARRRVEAELQQRAGALGPFEGLVRPGALAAKPPEWAALKGQRYERLATWLYHAANAPSIPTPEGVIAQLLRGQHGEYLLAHQYLVLRILRERGVLSGPGIETYMEGLLRDIEAEQRAEIGFSDLFAERQALLLSGGRVAEETSGWMARILAAQESDGRWRVPPHPYPTTLNELHTTLVSLWALDQYARILRMPMTRNAEPGAP